MFKKILLPTDGSQHSYRAACVAGEMASKYGGEVQPLVAVEYQYLTKGDLPPDVVEQVHAKIAARAQQALAGAEAAVRESGGTCLPGQIVEGAPDDAILRVAEDGEFDLIVLGSQGVSEEAGHARLLGSVAERVLHRTCCPVLVIRAEARR